MIVRHISGGYPGIVNLRVTDENGANLSGLTFKIVVVAVGAALPPDDDPDWRLPDSATYPAVGQAVLVIEYTEADVTPGDHWLWLQSPDEQAHKIELVRFE